MYFIENKRLIECKNKALESWSKHNFIFKQFADLMKQKIKEFKKKFNNILIISSDFDFYSMNYELSITLRLT